MTAGSDGSRAVGRVPLVRFAALSDTVHGISTRHGGVSPAPYDSLNLGYSTPDTEENVARNRQRFAAAVGIDGATIVAARLQHGNRVQVFSRDRPANECVDIAPVVSGSQRREAHFTADGAVSDVPGLQVLMTFADCVPLLFVDPRLRVVGAAHAGWRGTALGVGAHVVRAMRTDFGCDPADIFVGVGPSIGPCCYTVGPDVVTTVARAGVEPVLVHDATTTRLDLWSTNLRQLIHEGVRREHIENPRLCTSCNVHIFFSHRAEAGRTGRFGLLIGAPRPSE